MEFCLYGNFHTFGKLHYVCPLPSTEALDKTTVGNNGPVEPKTQSGGADCVFAFRAI